MACIDSVRRPNDDVADRQLQNVGMAVEYFPAFEESHVTAHTHDFVELLLVVSGRMEQVSHHERHTEGPGDLTVLTYEQYHTLRTPDGPVELFNVYWRPESYPVEGFPPELLPRLHELVPVHPVLRHRLNRVRHLHLSPVADAAGLLEDLHREQRSSQPGRVSAMDALFRLFLITVCRAAPAAPQDRVRGLDPLMERVRFHLEEHHADAIPLSSLAAMTGLGVSNLCGRFKRHTGLTVGEYLRQRRLATALRLLRTTDRTVASICHEAGFTDVSNFNRTFRRAIGCAPTAYRSATPDSGPARSASSPR